MKRILCPTAVIKITHSLALLSRVEIYGIDDNGERIKGKTFKLNDEESAKISKALPQRLRSHVEELFLDLKDS